MAELCDHKLDVLKLSEEPVELTGGLLLCGSSETA